MSREVEIYNALIKWKYISIILGVVFVITFFVMCYSLTHSVEVKQDTVQEQESFINDIPDRFIIVGEQTIINNGKAVIYVAYDTETNIEYAICKNGYNINITMLYDENGKPKICSGVGE